MTEKEKFLAWYKAEKEKGLRCIHIFPGNITPDTSEEDIYRELNLMNELGKTEFIPCKELI